MNLGIQTGPDKHSCSSVAFGDTFSHRGLLRSSEDLHAERLLRQASVWLVDLVSDLGFVGGVATLWLGAGRTYPVMATHRRMLKAIAAMVT
jgi:hypothetical protein